MQKAVSFFLSLCLLVSVCLQPAALLAAQPAKTKVKMIDKKEFLANVFNFEKSTWWRYEGAKPCFVEFTASWCAPCRLMEPIVDEVAEKYDGKILVYRVDIEKEKELIASFGVKSVPMLLFCPMEGKPKVVTGALPMEVVINAVEEVLLKNTSSSNK